GGAVFSLSVPPPSPTARPVRPPPAPTKRPATPAAPPGAPESGSRAAPTRAPPTRPYALPGTTPPRRRRTRRCAAGRVPAPRSRTPVNAAPCSRRLPPRRQGEPDHHPTPRHRTLNLWCRSRAELHHPRLRPLIPQGRLHGYRVWIPKGNRVHDPRRFAGLRGQPLDGRPVRQQLRVPPEHPQGHVVARVLIGGHPVAVTVEVGSHLADPDTCPGAGNAEPFTHGEHGPSVHVHAQIDAHLDRRIKKFRPECCNAQLSAA